MSDEDERIFDFSSSTDADGREWFDRQDWSGWHHVAVWQTGDARTVYVDGERQ